MKRKALIWISWEKHRRTRELCGEFSASLHELLFQGPYLLKLPILMGRTFLVVWKNRPITLIVQNPSVVLASFVGFLKGFFGYTLVVDRHSNFKLETTGSPIPKYKIFHWLSRYSIKVADITIVTNDFLCNLVNEIGGEGFILPDKFPALGKAAVEDLGPGKHILYICSFDNDEPIEVVLGAAKKIPKSVFIHITGNFEKMGEKLRQSAPSNIHFTGYLTEEKYLNILNSCAVVMTLTNNPHTMQCGAYEAVSVGKPLIIGPDKAMADYFFKGNIVSLLNPDDLAQSIVSALNNIETLEKETRELYDERSIYWEGLFEALMSVIETKILQKGREV